MSIRRLTIELDDSVDRTSPTKVPDSLIPSRQEKIDKDITPSSLPTHYEEENDTEEVIAYKAKQTGRTFPDLIAEFIDNPRAMSTILMFVPFIIFIPKIDSIISFKYPIFTGVLLNLVWFLVPPICKIASYIFKKK